MDTPDPRHEELRQRWTDRFVEVTPGRPELRRFEGRVGRVVTVNCNGKALVDFQDGAWYDITADEAYLRPLDPREAGPKYDPKANSARPFPDKQG